MWSRVSDINIIFSNPFGNNSRTRDSSQDNIEYLLRHIKYYPHIFACPIKSLEILQYSDNSITCWVSVTVLPNADPLAHVLKKNSKDVSLETENLRSFHFAIRSSADANWIVKMMRFVNRKFDHSYSDELFLSEISNLFLFLLDKNANTKRFIHKTSVIKDPTNYYMDPSLLESDELVKDVKEVTINNLQLSKQKIIHHLKRGENPNQRDSSGLSVLIQLMHLACNNRWTYHHNKAAAQAFLTEIAICLMVYKYNPFNRSNHFFNSTFEISAALGFWNIYDVIIRATAKPERQLAKRQALPQYIENDKIYTEFGRSNIRSCLMPVSFLQQDEIIALFEVFKEIFEIEHEVDESKIRENFCHALTSADRRIEIFYDGKDVIGFNLSHFRRDDAREDVTLHIDYSLLKKAYQGFGLIAYTQPKLGYAKRLYIANGRSPLQNYRVPIHFEANPNSYQLVKELLHFPKYQTEALSRDVENLTYGEYEGVCLYVHNGITCYVEDDVVAKSLPTRNEDLYDYFFRHYLCGINTPTELTANRAVPVRYLVGVRSFDAWATYCLQRMGIDVYTTLLTFTKLLHSVSWFIPKNASHVVSFHNALHHDEHAFFGNRRLPGIPQAGLINRLHPGSSAL